MIKCALCEEVGSSLASHVRKAHGMSKEDYVKKHGPVLASGSKERYSQVNKHNSQWISRAKERGEDLTEYWEKVSNAVRTSIMNSPEERERRSKMLGSLNKTDAFRKKASETAKKTSARRDIREQRAANLKKWRNNNREKFASLITKLFSTKKKTKPEVSLDVWLIKNFNGAFEYSQFFYSKSFNMISGRKQVDFASIDKNIIIEVDGPRHFKRELDGFFKIRDRDIALCNYSIRKKKTLIRISHDSWAHSTGNYSQFALDKIKEIINNPTVGAHFIGRCWNGEQYTVATSSEEVVKIYGV